jgi:hypothetical protein
MMVVWHHILEVHMTTAAGRVLADTQCDSHRAGYAILYLIRAWTTYKGSQKHLRSWSAPPPQRAATYSGCVNAVRTLRSELCVCVQLLCVYGQLSRSSVSTASSVSRVRSVQGATESFGSGGRQRRPMLVNSVVWCGAKNLRGGATHTA